MPTLYTEIEIDAPRRWVWRSLVQKHQWKYWNSFLFDCDPEREFRQGRRVSLALRRTPGEDETEFEPLVTLVQPEACLRWVSTIPGFKIEQAFELQSLDRDRTYYIHQETFSGALTRAIFPFIRQDEQQGIRRMARELKQYAERG